MSVLLSAFEIAKSFGARTLFENLTFSIESGQRIGLIGPNGAGKSTLLKLIAKQEVVDNGKMSWGKNLRIGYLSQNPTFAPDDNVLSGVLAGALDPYESDSYIRAEELISRLSLDTENIQRETLVSELSGGWRKKVALARELMREPELLLLDEPTNHLDLQSIFWLEEYLADQKQLAILTVTHDRVFLQKVANYIYDLDPRYKGGVLKVQGAYADYLESRSIQLEGQKSTEAARANDLRREMEWLRRGAKARQTKQKARIEKTYDLMDEVADLRLRNRDLKLDLDIAGAGRSPKKLIEGIHLMQQFSDRVLFENLDILISPKTRLGLIGKNGSGKSTLIRTLLGEIPPAGGSLKMADNIQVSYFEQHRDSLDPKLTVQQTLCPEGDYVHLHGKPVYIKSYLDRFHFRREQHDMPLEKLSGGEQSRLLIAKLMLTSANVLVLDEPTNDLDIETLDTLKEALDQFDGALILVSHDRFFVEQVCDTILAFVPNELLLPRERPGHLLRFAGFSQWQAWYDDRVIEIQGSQRKVEVEEIAEAKKPKRKLSFKEQRELDGMESNILKAETDFAELNKIMSSESIASNPHKLLEVSQAVAKLQQEIENLYARWSELNGQN